jgi:hypothetical protein
MSAHTASQPVTTNADPSAYPGRPHPEGRAHACCLLRTCAVTIPFIPGTNALWDPWQGSHNGKGLTEDAFDNATKVILNQDFVSGLTQPAKLLDYFPYLAPPPES